MYLRTFELASLIQKQSILGILYHPSKPLLKIEARHGAAGEDSPSMSLNGIQL